MHVCSLYLHVMTHVSVLPNFDSTYMQVTGESGKPSSCSYKVRPKDLCIFTAYKICSIIFKYTMHHVMMDAYV